MVHTTSYQSSPYYVIVHTASSLQVKKLRDGGGDAPPAATLALAVPADLQLKPERLTLGTEIGRGGFVVTHTTTTTTFQHVIVSKRRLLVVVTVLAS